MKLHRLLSACTAALCCAGLLTVLPQTAPALPASAADTIANPFIYADVPDDDIIRVGDTYYMVHTTMYFTPGVPIMKSKDLFSWEICGYVYDTYADGDVQNLKNGKHDYAHGQWATSLRYHDGTFYVFFGSYGTGKSYIYKTNDIESGNWTRTVLNGMYHDASMLFDDDGRKYLVYGAGGNISIKEFNDEMTDFKWGGLDKKLFSTGLSGLAGEGSHIHKIGDYYYIFLIAWPSGHPRLELCYRSKSLTGNWESKTVLESGLGTYGSGVAQGGVVQTPEGDWYALLFQDHGAVGRVPVLVPFRWENGWPVMGVNGKAPTTLQISGSYTGTPLAHDDDFSYDTNKLALEWQWNHNPDNSAWSVTDRPGWLRLTNKTTTNNSFLFARNTLTMRTEGPACSSVIKLDASHMKPGDYAGLSAFQFKYGNVGVYVSDDGRKHVYTARNNTTGTKVDNENHSITEQKDMNGDEVYLKVDFKFATVDGNFNVSNNIDQANFYYSFDGNNWTKIGDTLRMSYDLTLFTGYRSAIYSYGTKSTGGYADIDYFDYERAEWNAPVILEPDADGYWFHYTFEKGDEGFHSRGGETVASSGGAAFEGSRALAVTDRTSAWNGAAHNLSGVFKSGEAYSFSTVAMAPESAEGDVTFHFTLSYRGTDNEIHYEKIDTQSAAPGKWVQLANQSFMLPAGATEMQIYVETDAGSDSFYIDEMIGAPDGTALDGPKPEIRFTCGDLDNDGKITAKDLTLAKRYMMGEFPDKASELAADVNDNGRAEVADLVWYMKYLTGELDDFVFVDG